MRSIFLHLVQRFAIAVFGITCLVSLAGCGSGVTLAGGAGSPNGNGLAIGGAGSVYVIQDVVNSGTFVSSSILQFSLNASGNVLPTSTIEGSAGIVFYSIATDSAGTIYVGAYPRATMQMEILEYAAGSTGAATPIRTITGEPYNFVYSLANPNPTTFCLPLDIYAGPNGMLYVLSQDILGDMSVVELPASASGAVTPTRVLFGPATQIVDPENLSVDAAGNIYVTDLLATSGGTILVYQNSANGNAAPARVITNPLILTGVAADASGNVYAQLNAASGTGPGALVEYAAGANGMATPLKTIGGAATQIYEGGGLRLDAAGNLYMENLVQTGSTNSFSILAFSPSATGNVAPNVNFASPDWSTDSGLAVH